MFFYCLVGLGLYFTLVKFPHLLAFLVADNKDAVPGWAKEISSPLLVALLLTILLPKVPFLSSLDQWICQRLQNLAAIPWEVRRLSAELRADKFTTSEDECSAIRQRLLDDGFDSSDIVFDSVKTPAGAWSELTSLLHKIDDWESDRRMGGYLSSSSAELERLRKRHQLLSSKAKTCFHLLREEGEPSGSAKTHEAIIRYKEDFVEQVSRLHNDTLDFVARGVLYSELTDNARESRLKALGFSIDWPGPLFSLNQMMLLFAVVCIVMLSGFVLFSDTVRGLNFGLILTRAVMISIIYSAAVACAVLPKTKWSFARVNAGDVRPIAFYLVAGLMASSISFVSSLAFNSILTRGFVCGFERSSLTYPWALITFSTAVTTGVMIDNPQYEMFSRLQQRCLEGAIQGLAMLGVGYITYQWLAQLQQNSLSAALTCNLQYQPPRLSMIVMAGMVGFVIGYFIPTWYRKHLEVKVAEANKSLVAEPVVAAPGQRVIEV